MDAINRFGNIQKTFVSDSERAENETVQTTQQVPCTGVGDAADGFDNFRMPSFDLSHSSDPAVATQGNPFATPAETIDACSVFDVLNSGSGVAPGEAIAKKLPPVAFAEIVPGDALAKLPPMTEALTKKLEPTETLFKASTELVANSRRRPLNEQTLNDFIQNHLNVADQVSASKDVKNWIKTNFRLTPAQQITVDSLSQADIQRVQKAAVRAAELSKKLSVEFRDPAFDQEFFIMNKNQKREIDTLQLEENDDSIALKHMAGCKPEMIQRLREELKIKSTVG